MSEESLADAFPLDEADMEALPRGESAASPARRPDVVPLSSPFRQSSGRVTGLKQVRPWELHDSLIGGRFVPGFRDMLVPVELELLRTRVQSRSDAGFSASASLSAQLSQLRESSGNLSFFSLWCSFAMTSALEKTLHGMFFDVIGSRVTPLVGADEAETPAATQAFFHYFYLVASEVLTGLCVHPLNVVNTYRAINLTDDSLRTALREVRSRKSPFDGVSARLAHSITHRVATELLWSSMAVYLSPSRFLETPALPSADPKNSALYRRELADRAVRRWRQRMWLSFLRSVAGTAAGVICLPLSMIKTRIESQALSYKNTNVVYHGFFDALLHCCGLSSSRQTPFFPKGAVATCLKADLASLAIDTAASFAIFITGVVAVLAVESWGPLSALEFLALS